MTKPNNKIDEVEGYAKFTFPVNLDTEEVYCIQQVKKSLLRFLENEHYELEQDKLKYHTHILDKLESVLDKAEKAFKNEPSK